MFGYEFVNLDPEQVEERRRHLDQAGTWGYLLPIILLSTIYLARTLSRGLASKGASAKSPNVLQLYSRRLKWILESTYVPEFGPLIVQVVGLFYTSALLYLIINGTGKDYMHVTKAFGHVAVSQLPVHYLLSVKHPQSPVTLATGLTHERLNAYHRLLGRVIHALLAAHAILYLNFFVAIGVLGKRIQDWDVRYGLMAFWTVNILGLLAIPPIRRTLYHKVFYRSHALLSALLAVFVWLHVPYTRNYAAHAAFFWFINGRKGSMTDACKAKCKKLGGGLVEVTATLGGGLSWEKWVPGMHCYLCQGRFGPRTPFTVVDAKDQNRQTVISLVVRDLGGPMTSVLGKATAQNQTLELEIEGPYGEAQEYMPDVLKRIDEPVLILAGGVGATYALPIYLALAEKRKKATDLRFIWIVKKLEDAKWGLVMLRGKPNRNVQIYMTRDPDEETAVSAYAQAGIEILAGRSRPNLEKAVDSFLGSPGKNGQRPVSVMVCGPGGLSASLRSAVERHAWSGRKVRWYEEQFGFGGS